MFNYYVNQELVENYPKGSPRRFKFGETHYIEVINDVEDESTRVLNDRTLPSEYEDYDYKKSRAGIGGYAPLGEQQDMQYWDAVNGTTTWQDHITAVKEKYPKPNA